MRGSSANAPLELAAESLGLLRGERTADLARHEETAAHADPAVDLPAFDRHLRLRQLTLPGVDVGVDGVHKPPVEVEDQGARGDFSRIRWEYMDAGKRYYLCGSASGNSPARRITEGGRFL
jgi:hypothetical protein